MNTCSPSRDARPGPPRTAEAAAELAGLIGVGASGRTRMDAKTWARVAVNKLLASCMREARLELARQALRQRRKG